MAFDEYHRAPAMKLSAKGVWCRWSILACVICLSACREVTVEGHHVVRPPPTACGTLQTLATGLQDPTALAYATDYVYVAAGPLGTGGDLGAGQVLQIPLSGGTPVIVDDISGVITPNGLVADGSNVYEAHAHGGVGRASLDGKIQDDVPSLVYPLALALDANYIYVGGDDGTVSRVTLGDEDSLPQELYTPAGPAQVFDMTVDNNNVYWIEDVFGTTSLKAVPIAGGSAITLIKGTSSLRRIAVGGDYVYASSYRSDDSYTNGAGSILRARIDGTDAATEIASNQPFPTGIVVDARGIYWGGGDAGPESTGLPLVTLPTDGTPIATVAPHSITYTMKPCGDGICWLDSASGSVMRFQECAK
jgi:hypothetical protein